MKTQAVLQPPSEDAASPARGPEGLCPPFSARLARLSQRAKATTRRIVADEKIPCQEPDGRTPFLDAFEGHPDWPYCLCLAEGIAQSWLESERLIQPGEVLVGVPRPPRPLSEHFSWGIRCNLEVLKTPAYAGRAEDYQRRLGRLRPRLFPSTYAVIEAEGIRRLGSLEAFQAASRSLWSVAGYQGHTVPDFEKLLRLGIGGVLTEIRAWRAQHSEPRKVELLTACERIYDGLSGWIQGYADFAQQQARIAPEPEQRRELMEIADTCRAVATAAPRSLRQACQLLWFYVLWDDVDSLGRIDQYLFPFYQRDLETGRQTREQLFETLAALWINLMRWAAHTLTLGGQTPDGSDATNAVTWIGLELCRRLHDTHPRLTVRLHAQSPSELLASGVGLWSEGLADPTFVSDECVIPGLCRYGVSLSDARNYTVLGCQEIEVPGKSNTGCEDGILNLAKCMELALNDGRCRITGLQLGPRTGDPREFASFDEVWRAYRTQVEVLTDHFVALCNLGVGIRSANLAKLVRLPLTAHCLARGLDPDGGGALYGHGEAETMGIGAASDQLTAIRQVVFEEHRLSMAELAGLLEHNFAGREDLRQVLLRAPKFGNDDEVADEMARRVAEHFWETVGRYTSPRGGRYYGATALLGNGTAWGRRTGAGADGKRLGEPLGNTCGPRTGVDTRGLTALLRSVARLPFLMAPGGAPCNIKVPVRLLSSPESRGKVCALLRGFFDLGGQIVQTTPVDSATLRAAQANPEAYGDLLIRIGGFSARFINLSRADQDEIIARGEEL